MVDPSNEKSTRLGVEISDAGARAVVIGQDDAISDSRAVSIVDRQNPVPELITLISEMEREFDVKNVGIAVPGLVDRKTGRVAFSANMPGHSDVDLVNELRTASGLAVTIENDANAAAFGEFRLGAGRGCRNMFYATLGVGVGGAFIFGGEIWRGASGFAGEFGYVPINSEGMRLEDAASAANIIRRTRSRFNQDSTSSLNGMREEAITLQAIINAAASDDEFAKMMLGRTGTSVGTAVASVINLLNIEKIVVGGEIMQAKHVVLHAIKERARELSFEPSFNSTSIVEGELGMNAAAIGVAFISGEGN